MSKSTVLSINALLNKALMTIKLASTDRIDNGIKEENSTQENRLTVKQKVLSYNPLTTCQPHTLHYAMKGVGYLPTPLLESLVGLFERTYLKTISARRCSPAFDSRGE